MSFRSLPTGGTLLALFALLMPGSARAGEPLDWDAINRIRDEGFNRSEVMDTLRTLTDELGPRLTGSPRGQAASRWTKARLAEIGRAHV